MREKNSGRTMRLLCLSVSTLPVLYLSMFIYRFASPLPVHDQWDNVPFIVSMKEGRTSLSLLVRFHVEHLPVIPRLFFAVLACLFTWDNRLECWVTFVFTVMIFSLLCWVAVKAAAKGERIAYVALDSDIPLSLWHKSVADLAVRIDAGLANSNPGADCIHRVPLAVDSVGGTPHDNHLSHGSRRSFGGQWASGTSDIIRDSPQAVPCAHERQDVA